jgi:hypothetical protein
MTPEKSFGSERLLPRPRKYDNENCGGPQTDISPIRDYAPSDCGLYNKRIR